MSYQEEQSTPVSESFTEEQKSENMTSETPLKSATKRPRSKTERTASEQTWTLPRGTKNFDTPRRAQDDMIATTNRIYLTNGPVRPAPLPPLRRKATRKAPPPPSSLCNNPTLSYSPVPPPIPSSPRPSFSRTITPDLNLLIRRLEERPSPLPTRLSSRKSPQHPPMIEPTPLEEEEDLYEPAPSLSNYKEKDDQPPPLPSRLSTTFSMATPKPPPLSSLPSPKPPTPPPIRPPSVRPAPPLPPLPAKQKEDTGGHYCDLDSAVQMKTEYEGAKDTITNTGNEEHEEEVYTEMETKEEDNHSGNEDIPQQEDEYTIMAPALTPISLTKKQSSLITNAPQLPKPATPTLPRIPPRRFQQIPPQAPPTGISRTLPRASTPPSFSPNPSSTSRLKRKIPVPFFLASPAPKAFGIIKMLPKHKMSAPQLPPPSPPGSPSYDQQEDVYESVGSYSGHEEEEEERNIYL